MGASKWPNPKKLVSTQVSNFYLSCTLKMTVFLLITFGWETSRPNKLGGGVGVASNTHNEVVEFMHN